MAFELPPLPFAQTALEPHMSAHTLELHHGKHHAAYVKKLNALIKDGPLAAKSLEEIIQTAASDSAMADIFNNAAQVWNHTFLWNSLRPAGGAGPSGPLRTAIDEAFGGVAQFNEAFAKAAEHHFGSGWAWLVLGSGKLSIVTTSDAETPLTGAHVPLLTLDLWEHAYYVDYENRRPEYIAAYLEHLINWEFAAQNMQERA